MNRAEVDRHLAAFPDLCRQYGIKGTHQRTEIYRELLGTEEHPDAETVYRRVRERIPAISLDTVYRNLRLLEEKRIIGRVGTPGGPARFDGNGDRHHHFICVSCGAVIDVHNAELDSVRPPKVPDLGEVESIHVELRGVCRACKLKRRQAKGCR